MENEEDIPHGGKLRWIKRGDGSIPIIEVPPDVMRDPEKMKEIEALLVSLKRIKG